MSIHIWGIDAVMRDFARRFAKLGYVTIVPGLMDRSNPPNGDGIPSSGIQPFFAPFGKVFSDGYCHRRPACRLRLGSYQDRARQDRDLRKLRGRDARPPWRSPPTRVTRPRRSATAAPRFDRSNTQPPPPGSLDWTQKVSADVIGSYGGADQEHPGRYDHPGLRDVQAAPRPKVYPDAPHAYLDDTRDSYRPEAATDTWARMTAWYGKYLAYGLTRR